MTLTRNILVLAWLLAALACASDGGPAPSMAAGGDLTLPGDSATTGLFQRIIKTTLDPRQGGSTTDLNTGAAIDLGSRYVAVSLNGGSAVSSTTPDSELVEELEQFVAQNPRLRQHGHYLGTWLDAQSSLIYFDITMLLPYRDDQSRLAALAEANRIGVANGQKSVFDLGSGKTYRVDASRRQGHLDPY